MKNTNEEITYTIVRYYYKNDRPVNSKIIASGVPQFYARNYCDDNDTKDAFHYKWDERELYLLDRFIKKETFKNKWDNGIN